MEVPDTLKHKMEAFAQDGSIVLGEQESFTEQSWIALYSGFGLQPQRLPSGVKQLANEPLNKMLAGMARAIAGGAQAAPSHKDFLNTL